MDNMMLEETYIYEYITKWFGLKIGSVRICAETECIVWAGPWRWSRKKAFNDGLDHAYNIFIATFNEEDPAD